MRPINANSWPTKHSKEFKGREALALVKFRELKDNNQDTQPQQTKDIQKRFEKFK